MDTYDSIDSTNNKHSYSENHHSKLILGVFICALFAFSAIINVGNEEKSTSTLLVDSSYTATTERPDIDIDIGGPPRAIRARCPKTKRKKSTTVKAIANGLGIAAGVAAVVIYGNKLGWSVASTGNNNNNNNNNININSESAAVFAASYLSVVTIILRLRFALILILAILVSVCAAILVAMYNKDAKDIALPYLWEILAWDIYSNNNNVPQVPLSAKGLAEFLRFFAILSLAIYLSLFWVINLVVKKNIYV